MKAQYLSAISLFILISMASCKFTAVSKRATGLPYEVVVVMNKTFWEGEAGKMVQEELTTPVPALPQNEPSMRITYVPPAAFDGLLKYVRNILIVEVNPTAYTKTSLGYEKDEWATGQLVLRLKTPSSEALVEFLLTNESDLLNHFNQAERERRVALLTKSYSSLVMEKAQSKFGVQLYAPEDMTYYKDSTDFLWTSNNANTGRIDLLVYSFPYTDPETFTLDYLIAKRDSVLKRNLPGAFPNSYVSTEKRVESTYTPITLDGKYCGVLRGLWRMEGDQMGGPFVSHAILDEKNQRVIVAEGLVFAPETSKRNLIRKIEAALHTLRLP